MAALEERIKAEERRTWARSGSRRMPILAGTGTSAYERDSMKPDVTPQTPTEIPVQSFRFGALAGGIRPPDAAVLTIGNGPDTL